LWQLFKRFQSDCKRFKLVSAVDPSAVHGGVLKGRMDAFGRIPKARGDGIADMWKRAMQTGRPTECGEPG
jgi:hypothetical protein